MDLSDRLGMWNRQQTLAGRQTEAQIQKNNVSAAIEMLQLGLSNAQIAALLGITEQQAATIADYYTQMMKNQILSGQLQNAAARARL